MSAILSAAEYAESAEPPGGEWADPVPLSRVFHPPAFPVEALPRVVGDMVSAVATFTQTDPAMAGGVALATLAACCGGRVEVEVRPGWREPTNLYAAVIASPAERKSAVHARMTRPLFDAERRLVDESRPQVIEAEVQRDVARRASDRARAEAGNKAGDRSEETANAVAAAAMAEEIEVPVMPRLVVDDVTPEALVTVLAEQHGRIANLSAEAGVFDVIAGRYSSVPNVDVWLKAHAGDPLRIDRRGRPPEFVEHPALTVCVMVQPQVISTIGRNDSFRGRGLLARFLYIAPSSLVGRRKSDPEEIPGVVAARYDTAVTDLAVALAGWREPVLLTLTPQALKRLLVFADEVEPRLGPQGSLAHVADWAGKLVGAVARIAGLLHSFEYREVPSTTAPTVIDEDTIGQAITFGRFLTHHALVAFQAMASDPAANDAKHVIDVALAKTIEPVTSRRDIFAKVSRSRFPKVGDLDPVIALLCELGWIAHVEEERRDGPGRKPSPRYALHPHLTHFADSADSAARSWTS